MNVVLIRTCIWLFLSTCNLKAFMSNTKVYPNASEKDFISISTQNICCLMEHYMSFQHELTKLRGLSLQANYNDRAAAACRRS
jgi:hypothetical protein